MVTRVTSQLIFAVIVTVHWVGEDVQHGVTTVVSLIGYSVMVNLIVGMVRMRDPRIVSNVTQRKNLFVEMDVVFLIDGLVILKMIVSYIPIRNPHSLITVLLLVT